MGILTRFKDIMSSNINTLLDKAEDPEKMIDQCLRNLNNDLGKVKSETMLLKPFQQAMTVMQGCSLRRNRHLLPNRLNSSRYMTLPILIQKICVR